MTEIFIDGRFAGKTEKPDNDTYQYCIVVDILKSIK